MVLITGAFLVFFSVAFGAYSEHGLRPIITDEEFRFLMTAIRYNQVNAVMICALGLSILSEHKINQLKLFGQSTKAFIIGTFLFSFSIYLSVFLGIKEITYLTPIGGIVLMFAWILLIATRVKFNNRYS